MAKRNKQLDLEMAIARQVAADLDSRGREQVDSVPMAPPVGFKPQPSMIENIRALVRSESLRHAAETAGFETFEEAEDFDVGDDIEPSSPYEQQFEPAPAAALRDYVSPEDLRTPSASPAAPQATSPNPPSDGPGTPPQAPASGTPVPSTAPAKPSA